MCTKLLFALASSLARRLLALRVRVCGCLCVRARIARHAQYARTRKAFNSCGSVQSGPSERLCAGKLCACLTREAPAPLCTPRCPMAASKLAPSCRFQHTATTTAAAAKEHIHKYTLAYGRSLHRFSISVAIAATTTTTLAAVVFVAVSVVRFWTQFCCHCQPVSQSARGPMRDDLSISFGRWFIERPPKGLAPDRPVV